MAFTVEDAICNDTKIKKHIISLKKPVQQTKRAILDKLKKSEKRYKEEISLIDELKKKTLLLKKLDKITKEQNILENMLEDDILKFALTTQQNLMALASNRRMPLTLRIKARVASHKPLSVHIGRIKSKLKKSEESADEEESENDEECEINEESKIKKVSEDTKESVNESSKPLDKMCVNNQIVKMRKNVKQAKVYIIHKLTRNIQKLRKVKGKNEEKYKKKADRMVKKIQCLKGIHENDISRFALTSTQDLTKLSTDINSSLKQQIMATVAIHRCVLPTIVEFKNKFPDFDDKKVSNILKQKKKKRKLNIETKENSSGNSKPLNKKPKASSLIRVSEGSEMESEHDEEENEYENELSDEESGQSKSDEQNDDSICPSEESETDSRKDNQNNLNHEKTDFNENDVVSNQESESDERTLKKNHNINRKTNKTLLLKNNKSVTKSLSENNYSSGEDNKVSNSSKKAESSKKSEIKKTTTKKVIDPFFVTSTNEEYVTSQVPTVNEDSHFSWRERDKNADSRESNKFHKNSKKWDNKEDYKTQRKFNKYDNQPYNKPMFNNFDKGHNNSKFSASNFVVGNRKERRKALHQPPIKEEKLHPSWEAKKKLSSIANFQGKKIKFD